MTKKDDTAKSKMDAETAAPKTPPTAEEIEQSIKLALSAADTATNVAGEFNKIARDYGDVERGAKKILRMTTTVFISAAIATVGALTFSAMMHNRTLTEMETANNTSLEALVIFAENIEKLNEVTDRAQATLARQDEVEAAVKAAQAASEAAAATLATTKEELRAEMMAQLQEQMVTLDAYLDAASGRIDTALAEQVMVLDAALTPMAETIEKLRNQELIRIEEPAPQGEAATPAITLELLDQKLETMMLLQKELSAKINLGTAPATTRAARATPAPAARTTPRTVRKPKTDGNVITYP